VGPGDEVLIPVPTHVVVPNAVRYLGARPVYVDCLPASVNIDLEDARRKLSPRTRALVLQHTFGVPAEIDDALALADEAGIAVIEDCVHALGATWHGRPVGGFGRSAIFSTEETKVISTTIGGALTTNDASLARRVRELREGCSWPSGRQQSQWMAKLLTYHLLTHRAIHGPARDLYERIGKRHPLSHPVAPEESEGDRPLGYLRRMGAAQAQLATRQLARLEANVGHRRWAAARYADRLEGAGWRQQIPSASEPSFLRYPVLVADREAAVSALRGIVVPGTWFTSVLEEATDPVVAGYRPGSCPVAEAFTRQLLNLPTHPRVSAGDIDAIAAAVRPHLVTGITVRAG
jgi:perosamine synthetase